VSIANEYNAGEESHKGKHEEALADGLTVFLKPLESRELGLPYTSYPPSLPPTGAVGKAPQRSLFKCLSAASCLRR
jgi:hypothetical protein